MLWVIGGFIVEFFEFKIMLQVVLLMLVGGMVVFSFGYSLMV